MSEFENKSLKEKNTLLKVMDFTVDKVIEMKKNTNVFDGIIKENDMTIIPISKVSVGFAGGGADISDRTKGKYKNPAGTGAGITNTPMVFLVVKNNEVNILRVAEETYKKTPAADVISTIIEEAKKIIEENKAKKEALKAEL